MRANSATEDIMYKIFPLLSLVDWMDAVGVWYQMVDDVVSFVGSRHTSLRLWALSYTNNGHFIRWWCSNLRFYFRRLLTKIEFARCLKELVFFLHAFPARITFCWIYSFCRRYWWFETPLHCSLRLCVTKVLKRLAYYRTSLYTVGSLGWSRTLATNVFTRDSMNCYRASKPSQFCPSVRPSHGWMSSDQAKTVQARIIKSSPSAAPKTLVSGSVTLFQKSHRSHPNRGPWMRGGRKILRFWTNSWPYLGNGAR